MNYPKQAVAENLKQLLIIRIIVIFGQVLAAVYAYTQLDLGINYAALALLITVNTIFTLYSWAKLESASFVSEKMMFCQISADIFILSSMLYFSGGATNPFVSYLLIPISIAATTLKMRLIWMIAFTCIAAYSILLFKYFPVELFQPSMHSNHDDMLNPHILGMWCNFVLSTLLITYFVVQMASRLRERENQLQTQREQSLQDEQILAIATLAAGTAHELATPLSTLAVALEDLEDQNLHAPDNAAIFSTLLGQVDLCRKTLRSLVATADGQYATSTITISCKNYFAQLLEDWQLLRPEANISFELSNDKVGQAVMHTTPTLKQALLNLLNNAADACPDKLALHIRLEKTTLVVDLLDNGPGVPLALIDQLGTPFVSQKKDGMGLGFYLSHTTINKLGGKVGLFNREQGGTLTQISLPLNYSLVN